DWHGMGLLHFFDGYRTHENDATTFASGNSTVIEYFPQWLLYQVAPYKYATGYIITKSSESQDIYTDPTGGSVWTTTLIEPLLQNVARIYCPSINQTQGKLARWLVENLWYSDAKIPQGASGATYTVMNQFGLWANYLGYNT